MAKRLINKRLLNEYYNNEKAPSGMLFEQKEGHLDRSTFVSLTISGMDITEKSELGIKGDEYGHFPIQTLSNRTQFINAESVRKLFGAQNYSEMLLCIKARFHDETAYDDLIDYLQENNIV